MSKRIKHLAGDPIAAVNLPFGCYWVRVTDFEPIGMIDPNLPFLSPGGNIVGGFEPPAIKLDGRDPVPVYDYTRYAKLFGGTYGTVELLGNIEIEVGESGDADPGPIVLPAFDSTASFSAGSATLVELPLPKRTRSVSLQLINAGFQITAVSVSGQYFNKGSAQGTQTPWRPGGHWAGKDNTLTQIFPFFSFAGGPVQQLLLELMQGQTPADDAVNSVYVRPWAPTPVLSLLVTTANASSTPVFVNFSR